MPLYNSYRKPLITEDFNDSYLSFDNLAVNIIIIIILFICFL